MGNQKLKASEIKQNYSIVDLLSRLGFEPVNKAGKEKRFVSMLRDSDITPSFSVNDRKGAWRDFGDDTGGNIIDFGLRYWPRLSFSEVLEKIVETCDGPVQNYQRQQGPVKEPNYQILDIKDLGCNYAILNYLESRGIASVAGGRLKEIYYYVEDEAKKRNNFFAAGWQNEQGAWEVRNVNFKGCLGHKAISFIPNSERKLAVFEGFFNYLSWLTENPFATESVLVLNSLSLLHPGIIKAQQFECIALYLDNDPSGRQATNNFIATLPQAKDCAYKYEGYNDYNDRIVAEQQNYGLNRE